MGGVSGNESLKPDLRKAARREEARQGSIKHALKMSGIFIAPIMEGSKKLVALLLVLSLSKDLVASLGTDPALASVTRDPCPVTRPPWSRMAGHRPRATAPPFAEQALAAPLALAHRAIVGARDWRVRQSGGERGAWASRSSFGWVILPGFTNVNITGKSSLFALGAVASIGLGIWIGIRYHKPIRSFWNRKIRPVIRHLEREFSEGKIWLYGMQFLATGVNFFNRGSLTTLHDPYLVMVLLWLPGTVLGYLGWRLVMALGFVRKKEPQKPPASWRQIALLAAIGASSQLGYILTFNALPPVTANACLQLTGVIMWIWGIGVLKDRKYWKQTSVVFALSLLAAALQIGAGFIQGSVVAVGLGDPVAIGGGFLTAAAGAAFYILLNQIRVAPMTITFISATLNSLIAVGAFWGHHQFDLNETLAAAAVVPLWLGLSYAGIGLFQIFLRFGYSINIFQHRSLTSTSSTHFFGQPMHVALDKAGPWAVEKLGHPGVFPGEPIGPLNWAGFLTGVAAAVLSLFQIHKPNLREIQHEREEVERTVAKWTKAVVVFGSARIKEGKGSRYADEVIQQARDLGAAIWRAGLVPRTGAGPSIMDAAPLGYRQAAKADRAEIAPDREPQGVRIDKLPFEKFSTPEIRKEWLLRCIHFVTRKLGLHTNSYGAIAMAGGYGTDDEDFEVLRRRMPLVLLDPPNGPSYWTPIMEKLEAFWVAEGLSEQAQPRPLITRDVNEAVRYVKEQSERRPGTPTLDAKTANRELEDGIRIMDQWKRRRPTGLDGKRPMTIAFIGRPGPDSLDRARRLARMLLAYPNICIRVGTRGPLFAAIAEIMREAGQMDRLESVLFVPVGKELTVEERAVPKTVFTHDESNHQVELTKEADALVVFPGRAGTLNKLFDVVQLIQTKKIGRPLKIVLLSAHNTWEPFIQTVTHKALHPFGRSDSTQLIAAEDQRLFQTAATERKAIHLLGLNNKNNEKSGGGGKRGSWHMRIPGTGWTFGFSRPAARAVKPGKRFTAVELAA